MRAVRAASQPGPHQGKRFVGCRGEKPDHGAVHSVGGAGQHRGMSQKPSREHSHAMQNETRQTTPAAAFGRSSIKRLPSQAPRGRRSGHRGRRHHRPDHRPHQGRGRDMLALGRRPLRQEHARHDPPAAGDRPHHQGVGGCAGRAARGSHGAHPDRDPAGDGALHHGQPQRTGRARVDGGARPASPSPSSASRAPTSCAWTGSGRRRRPRRAPAGPRARAGSRRRPSPSSARRWKAGPPPPPRTVTSVPVDPWNPAEARLYPSIPADPSESRLNNSFPSHGMTEGMPGG